MSGAPSNVRPELEPEVVVPWRKNPKGNLTKKKRDRNNPVPGQNDSVRKKGKLIGSR